MQLKLCHVGWILMDTAIICERCVLSPGSVQLLIALDMLQVGKQSSLRMKRIAVTACGKHLTPARKNTWHHRRIYCRGISKVSHVTLVKPREQVTRDLRDLLQQQAK
eukprot:1399049-Amphidinium_carterae.1